VKYELTTFFLAWLTNPLQVAAIMPSGRALARLITAEISPHTGRVLELGAGTGAFTRALLSRGIREQDLTLVENGSGFAQMLDVHFPRARVLQMDAAQLGSDEFLGADPVGAVVSGLPVLSMPRHKVEAILSGAFSHLRPGGNFYQFTYGPACPVRRPVLENLGLRAERLGRAVLNMPPAAVYRISRS
jgi:phosphatidylethanolamine/phosphatidyl-N-methylethanolamine N-methyltransferase